MIENHVFVMLYNTEMEDYNMWSIVKREVRNYIRKPLYWIGILAVFFMVFQSVSPYLHTHYLAEGETIVN